MAGEQQKNTGDERKIAHSDGAGEGDSSATKEGAQGGESQRTTSGQTQPSGGRGDAARR
jgi:hypothetical protein